MRHWIWILPLSLVVLITGGLLLAPTWAKSEARSQAKARGLVLEIESLSLGMLSAELTDPRVRLEGVEGVSTRFDKVRVELSLSSPRVRAVFVEGGEIEIEGTVEEIKQQLSDWRARRPARKETKGKGGIRRFESVRGLNLTWHGALEEGDKQRIEGINLERGKKEQRVGLDLVQLSLGPLTGEVAGIEVKLPAGSFDFASAKLNAAEVRLTLRAPAEEKVAAQKLPQRPSVHLGQSPQKKKAAGLEDRLQKDQGRVLRLLAGLKVARERILPKLPPETKIDRFWLTYLRGEDRLHVGPSLLKMRKDDVGFHTSIEPKGETKGTPLSLSLSLHPPAAESALSLRLEGGPISLSTLGIKEGAFGLQGVRHTRVSGTAKVQLSQDAKTLSGDGQVSIQELTLESTRLSERLVSFPALKLAGKGSLAVDGTHYKLDDVAISLGETEFQASLDMERGEDFVSLKANAKAPLVSCQGLVDSAPRGLLGAVERIRFKGTFSLDAGVEADTRQLSKMRVRWDFKNDCHALKVPAELDPARFHGIFRREVLGAGNYPMELEFGPLSSTWVDFDEVSPFVEKALLVTEDGRFHRHNGFDNRAIESAIRDNARAGRFVRGASTISMQLAKNLYLSRDKTLARKFREVALTSLLEQSFSKKEILELYVNVIEFGPGIYGIQKAAEYYFSSTPRRLTAAQAFFLASILPLPSYQYFGADGRLSEARVDYIHLLLGISKKREALSEAELETALKEVLVFGQKDTLPEETEEESASATESTAEGKAFNGLPNDDPSRLTPPAQNAKKPKKTPRPKARAPKKAIFPNE